MAVELSDITIDGPRFRNHGVRVGTEDPRPWLARFSVCPALARYRILHTGFHSVHLPYRIVRVKQTSSYFLACLGGEGRVMLDGRWQAIRPCTACLLPPHIRIEFKAAGVKAWEFCYVCYSSHNQDLPVSSVTSPLLASYDSDPLHCAIAGFEAECRASAAPATVHRWIELIQTYVLRFKYPVASEDPLHLLWEHVAGNLRAHWTLDELARHAHFSKEHLRRLCLRHLGRSPMNHLTHLRLQRAAELLVSSDQKVASVACQVGYASAFSFSATFKKWIGWAPSDYRGKGSTPGHPR